MQWANNIVKGRIGEFEGGGSAVPWKDRDGISRGNRVGIHLGDGWKDGACVKDGIFCGGWQGLRIVRVWCCAGDWTVCLAFRLTR